MYSFKSAQIKHRLRIGNSAEEPLLFLCDGSQLTTKTKESSLSMGFTRYSPVVSEEVVALKRQKTGRLPSQGWRALRRDVIVA